MNKHNNSRTSKKPTQEQTAAPCYILNIGYDVLSIILQNLPLYEVARTARVCKQFLQVARSKNLWITMLKRYGACTDVTAETFWDWQSIFHVYWTCLEKCVIRTFIAASSSNRISFENGTFIDKTTENTVHKSVFIQSLEAVTHWHFISLIVSVLAIIVRLKIGVLVREKV
jgi:hypothetical protein